MIMLKKIVKTIFHPVLIYVVIFILECIPIKKPIVYNDMPKEGENFKTESTDSVFYYIKKQKYFYESEECYFSFGNLPFNKTYKEGGIKVVTEDVAWSIPLGGPMCGDKKLVKTEKKSHGFFEKYFNIGFFLMQFSAIAHFLVYALLAFSTRYKFQQIKRPYWFAFLVGVLGGGLLEVIQHIFVEGRSASSDDMLLNTLGTLFGLLSFWLIKKYSSLLK